jgi:Protein of unknown function with HXXEE motif
LILVFILLAAVVCETIAEGPSGWLAILGFVWPDFSLRNCLALWVVLHILEEHVTGFREFFNYEIMKSSRGDRPVRVWEAILKDELGLGIALVTLCLLSGSHPWMLSAALGFVAADAIQHVLYCRDIYSPGALTAVVLYVPTTICGLIRYPIHWLIFVAGAAALVGNFLFAVARRKAD